MLKLLHHPGTLTSPPFTTPLLKLYNTPKVYITPFTTPHTSPQKFTSPPFTSPPYITPKSLQHPKNHNTPPQGGIYPKNFSPAASCPYTVIRTVPQMMFFTHCIQRYWNNLKISVYIAPLANFFYTLYIAPRAKIVLPPIL